MTTRRGNETKRTRKPKPAPMSDGFPDPTARAEAAVEKAAETFAPPAHEDGPSDEEVRALAAKVPHVSIVNGSLAVVDESTPRHVKEACERWGGQCGWQKMLAGTP